MSAERETAPMPAAAEAAPRAARLRTHLVALVLAVLLPALLFAGAASREMLRSQRAASEARLLDTARALSAAVDSLVAGHLAALTVLAASPDADEDGDAARFRSLAEATGEAFGAWVLAFARDGSQLLNTALPPEAGLPGPVTGAGPGPEAIARVFATGRPLVTDILAGRVSRRSLALVYVPVLREGEVQRVVAMPLLPERLSELLAAGRAATEAGAAALTDGRGVLAARSREAESVVGQPRPSRAEPDPEGPSGLLRGRSLADGSPIRTAFHHLATAPGWTVWVSEPEASFSAGWRASLLALAGGGALALLAGLAGTAALSRRLLRPVEALVAHAEAVGAGRIPQDAAAPAAPPAGVAEFERLRRALTGAEAALREGEARLRRVQRIGRVGGFEIDLRSGANWRSAEYMALQGLAPQTAREAHQDWVRRLHPEDRGRAERAFLAAVADGAPDTAYAQDYRVVTPEGEVRWISARAVIERDAEGRATRMVGAHLDVTPLKTAEAELRGVLEAAGDGVIAVDAGWRITFLSGRGAALLAVGRDPAGMELWDAFGDTALRPFAAAWRRSMAERASATAEAVYAPTGRILTAESHPRADGGIAVFFRDVTEERAASARLRAVLDSAPVGIVVAEAPSGRILLGNRRSEEVLRRSRLGGPGEGARLAAPDGPLRRALDGEEVAPVEMRVRRGDGSFTWLSVTAAPVRDAATEAVTGAVVVFADVDAARRAAAAVTESEARLRLALDAGQVGTFDWNLRTGELAWDPRMRELFALPPGMAVSFEVFQGGVHPDDLARVQAAIEAALDPAGEGAIRIEYRVIGLSDAVERHLSAQGRTEFAEGRPVRMIGVATDVTPLRRAAEVLAREAEQLERLAERRGRALAESEARLAQATRMEALGRLAGGIAHDINNVLQAVQGGLRLAARRLDTDPEGARRYLTLAGDAASRGAGVTGRLLSFARRGELRAEPVAPAPLLEGLAEMLRPTLGPDIALRVAAGPDLPALSADRSQLESVLVNLANNARDAMPAGGVLTLAAEAPAGGAPRPAELRPGAYLRLSVADEGQGMAAEVLARVTEPFFTTKPRGQGTGLGLAMARGFAEQSGGALAIESAVGRGTTVALWLPVAGAAEAPSPPGPAPRPAMPRGARQTVLLAEDQPEIREMIGVELEECGFAVARAPDAGVALALLDGGLRPDAIVTDFAMPGGLDGLDLVEAARRRLPRLAVVLVTGHVGDAAAERLEAVERGGPFALVRKPVAAETLLECLARVLDRRPLEWSRFAVPPGRA
jgi:signal transduction histidine kinase/ActR/RegA family two-component response regulator